MSQERLDWPHYKLRRNTDPETSALGARDAAARLGDLHREALAAVSGHPELTAQELEREAGVPRSTYGRRLGELERKGLVQRGKARKCRVTGRMAATWSKV